MRKSGTKIFNRKGIASIEYIEDFTIPASLSDYLKEIELFNPNVEDVRLRMMAMYPQSNQIPFEGCGGISGSASGILGRSSGSSANSSIMEDVSSGSGSSKQ